MLTRKPRLCNEKAAVFKVTVSIKEENYYLIGKLK